MKQAQFAAWMLVWAAVLLAGCRYVSNSESTAIPATAERSTIVVRPSPTLTASPFVSTGVPSPIPATAEPTTVPTAATAPIATPHPLFPYTIPGLRTLNFPGGPIQVRAILEQNDVFSRYYINYPSDNQTITGVMHVPNGTGPFPVLILLHGYIDRDQYYAGADTGQAAEFFARQGYLVLAPDLRSWGESDSGLSLFHMGLVVDVLHLISSLSSLPEADPARVGLWGHSMGGGIATKVLTIDDRARAAVLYAPNSADDADLIARWGPGCLPGQSEAAGDRCNPAEIIPPNTSQVLIEAYLSAAADRRVLAAGSASLSCGKDKCAPSNSRWHGRRRVPGRNAAGMVRKTGNSFDDCRSRGCLLHLSRAGTFLYGGKLDHLS